MSLWLSTQITLINDSIQNNDLQGNLFIMITKFTEGSKYTILRNCLFLSFLIYHTNTKTQHPGHTPNTTDAVVYQNGHPDYVPKKNINL